MNIESKKNNILAVKGGQKTIYTKGPHYVWPPITRHTRQSVMRQLNSSISIYNRSGIFEDFEKLFAKLHDRKYSLLCSSGTLAIHSMFFAAGFTEGDEVICPAYTFFATVTPLLQTGAVPILCDCDENGNIDPDEIEKKITPKTKGIVVTHMWGMPCQMKRIIKICRDKKILLLEDCSHAHGAKIDDQYVGSFGDIAAWSLQGQKNVSGGEGGILVTNNPEFHYRALILGHYNKRCKQEIPENHPLYEFSTTGIGLKYRAHPLAVSVAYDNLKKIEEYSSNRSRLASLLYKEFNNHEGFKPPMLMEGIKPSWYAFIFRYNNKYFGGLTIESFYEALRAEGLCDVDRPHSTAPLNLLPLFQKPGVLLPVYRNNNFSYKEGDFPRAEEFYSNIIKMPIWALKKDTHFMLSYIKAIKKVIANYKSLF